MIRTLFCFTFLLAFHLVGQAQTINSILQNRQRIELEYTTQETYNSLNHSYTTNPFHRFSFRAQGEFTFQKVGRFGRKIRPYLKDNEEALTYLNHFSTKRKIATITSVTGATSAVVFIVKNIKMSGHEGGPYYKGALGAVITSSLATALFAYLSNEDMETAVDIYNQAPLKTSQKKRAPSLRLGMQTSSYQARTHSYPTMNLTFKF